MLFNSFTFLIFFPVVVTIYFVIPYRFRWAWLLAASCYFYMAFIPAYILILFFTIGIDYVAGILIENAAGTRRKSLPGTADDVKTGPVIARLQQVVRRPEGRRPALGQERMRGGTCRRNRRACCRSRLSRFCRP